MSDGKRFEPTWVIDTHVHMWDQTRSELAYKWLDPSTPHPIMTKQEIKKLAVPIEDGRAVARYCREGGVPAVVHVQAAVGTANPVNETHWLESQRHLHGFPQAIVGSADLTRPEVGDILDEHVSASNAFRGVRDFGRGTEYLDDPSWIRGIAALGQRGLVACVDVSVERMPSLENLARAHPECTLIVDHMGMPNPRNLEFKAAWREAMSRLAKYANLYCKVSEQTMVRHCWDRTEAMDWMRSCINIFGPLRCFFGSNWPVDSLYVGYGEIVDSYRDLANEYGAADSSDLRWGTAAKVFGIQPADFIFLKYT